MKRYLLYLLAMLLAACNSGAPSHVPPPTQSFQVAFSPGADAEVLVLNTIDSAQQNIRLAAFSFTSPAVVKRLLAAKQRGVDVRIVVDHKGNTAKASIAAMNLMVNAGIPLRTISKYRIHHDKYLVVDNKTVETGSFNYSQSAAKYNSENVLVIENNPQLARQYLQHWQSRWAQGKSWRSTY